MSPLSTNSYGLLTRSPFFKGSPLTVNNIAQLNEQEHNEITFGDAMDSAMLIYQDN